jgi:hypothetical protein
MNAPSPVWGKITRDGSPWRDTPQLGAGVRQRQLGSGSGPSILEVELPPHGTLRPHQLRAESLWLVDAGSVNIEGEGDCGVEDVRHVPKLVWTQPAHAGAMGARILILGLDGPAEIIASTEAPAAASHARARRASLRDTPFLDFPDAAGRETQPVQLLFTDGPHVLRTRFNPRFTAGEHWHDFDTVYFVREGGMQFGPQEPWYEAGDIRWVRGGHAYGPEQPGPAGVDFVLVSLGGPVSLHWADLEAAPRGRIPRLREHAPT